MEALNDSFAHTTINEGSFAESINEGSPMDQSVDGTAEARNYEGTLPEVMALVKEEFPWLWVEKTHPKNPSDEGHVELWAEGVEFQLW